MLLENEFGDHGDSSGDTKRHKLSLVNPLFVGGNQIPRNIWQVVTGIILWTRPLTLSLMLRETPPPRELSRKLFRLRLSNYVSDPLPRPHILPCSIARITQKELMFRGYWDNIEFLVIELSICLLED